MIKLFKRLRKKIRDDYFGQSDAFYDAEYDTWFRGRQEDIARWEHQPSNRACNCPPKEPKYKMSPHKFE